MIRKSVFALFILIATADFSNAEEPTGVYGGCNCATENENSPRLLISDDQTFLYKKDRHTTFSGTWIRRGNYIYLSDKSHSFSQRWKLNREGTCIKSREALLFLRICRTGT